MDYEHIDDSVGEPPAEWPEHFEGRARIQPFPNPFPAGGRWRRATWWSLSQVSGTGTAAPPTPP